jgi:hypothetical protein
MILYHPLPLFFHFLKLLLNFFLFPAVMSDNDIYRTLLVLVFSLPTVGNQAKPQTDTSSIPVIGRLFWSPTNDRPSRLPIH